MSRRRAVPALAASLGLVLGGLLVTERGQGGEGVPPQAAAALTATVRPGSPLTVRVEAPGLVEPGRWFPVDVLVGNAGAVELEKGEALLEATPRGLKVRPGRRRWRLGPFGEERLAFEGRSRTEGEFQLRAFAEGELTSGERVSAWSEPVTVVVYGAAGFADGLEEGGRPVPDQSDEHGEAAGQPLRHGEEEHLEGEAGEPSAERNQDESRPEGERGPEEPGGPEKERRPASGAAESGQRKGPLDAPQSQ